MSTTGPTNCNCLCAVNHPEVDGICTATAADSIVFDSEMTGRVDVTMCSACAAATLVSVPADLRP